MNALDHATFHALEMDALYDELDGPRAAEIRVHAASCASCASRFERLRRARMRGLATLAEPVSNDFEARVMAAVDAALANRNGGERGMGGPVIAARPGAGAKVIPFFSRPSFAVAATLILVLGAAAILGQLSMAKKASPEATAAAPAAELAASSLTATAMPEQPFAAATAPAAAAPVLALAKEPSPGDETDDANGLAERGRTGAPAAAPRPAARRPATLAANDPAPPPPSPAKSKPVGGASGGATGSTDATVGAAKALYNAGNYRDALPRFEALRASSPEADLYAARCIQRLSGCGAAIPRFDGVASRNAGSDIGNRARAESESCSVRLQAAKNPAPAATATTGPGTPGGGGAAGRPSAPKAPLEQLDSK